MNFIEVILKSYSHIFFQENIIFGSLIVLGLAVSSPKTLLLSLIGAIIGLLTAVALKVPKPIIELGIYGLNGILIGCMISVYIKQLPVAIVLTILTSIIGAIIFFVFFRNHILPFAAPFVVMAWAVIILANFLKLAVNDF